MAQRVQVIGADFLREALPRGFDAVLFQCLHAHGVVETAPATQLHRCLNPGDV
jgi:hypothetical protein